MVATLRVLCLSNYESQTYLNNDKTVYEELYNDNQCEFKNKYSLTCSQNIVFCGKFV